MSYQEEITTLIESVEKPRQPKQRYIKPDAVKELEKLWFEFQYKDSALPEYIKTKDKFNDNSANSLTKCILKYAEIKGCFSTRLASTGTYRADIKKYIPSYQKKGLPDVLITTPQGLTVFCEVKFGKDKLSTYQIKIKDEIESRNGVFYVAKNFTDFKNWFDDILENNKNLQKNGTSKR